MDTVIMQRMILAVVVIYGAHATNYCAISPQHTMCLYKGIGERCGKKAPTRGVSRTERKIIINVHNRLRAQVANGQQLPQPKAADMMELKWNDELAKVAQRHVEQCEFEHDCKDCRKIHTTGSVGQNLLMTSSSRRSPQSNWTAAINDWFSEVTKFDSSDVDHYRSTKGTGHYTQLVWASTTHVGCGFVEFENDGKWHKMYGCNYSPAGNVIGAAIYNQGKPCSDCPNKCSTKIKGICAQPGFFANTGTSFRNIFG